MWFNSSTEPYQKCNGNFVISSYLDRDKSFESSTSGIANERTYMNAQITAPDAIHTPLRRGLTNKENSLNAERGRRGHPELGPVLESIKKLEDEKRVMKERMKTQSSAQKSPSHHQQLTFSPEYLLTIRKYALMHFFRWLRLGKECRPQNLNELMFANSGSKADLGRSRTPKRDGIQIASRCEDPAKLRAKSKQQLIHDVLSNSFDSNELREIIKGLQERLHGRQGGVGGTADYSEEQPCTFGAMLIAEEGGSGGISGMDEDSLQIMQLQAEVIESSFFPF